MRAAITKKAASPSIVREYPKAEGEPYYPIPRTANEMLYKRYQELAQLDPHVSFVGRLAEYRYYNMDQVVGAALKTASEVLKTLQDSLSPGAAA